jgi:hypothetical protein
MTRIEQLIRTIENAPDFGYDDEAIELKDLLAKQGKAWKWAGSRVEVYEVAV